LALINRKLNYMKSRKKKGWGAAPLKAAWLWWWAAWWWWWRAALDATRWLVDWHRHWERNRVEAWLWLLLLERLQNKVNSLIKHYGYKTVIFIKF
jgi:hypothetical protein